MWVTLGVLAVLIVLVLLMWSPDRLLGGPRFDVTARGALAVMPFENATGETAQAWVGHGLAPMLAEVIATVPGLEVVPPSAVERALDVPERHLLTPVDAAEGSAEAWRRTRMAAIGADWVLEARVARRRGGYRIEAALIEVALIETGDAEPEWVAYTDDSVLAAAEDLASAVAQAFDPDALAPTFSRVFSGGPFLDRLYGTARHLLANEGPEAAAPFFEALTRLDPGFLAARMGRAACAQARGDYERARAEWLEILVSAQREEDRSHQAATLAALAEIATVEGRAEESEELHLQAQAMLSSRGDRRGQADVLESRARLALSERKLDRAEALFLEILGLREAVGDRLGRAGTLLEVGALRLAANDLDGAESLFRDAREIAGTIGDPAIEMSAAANLGDIAAARGDDAAADAMWGEALEYDRRRGAHQRALMLSARRADLAYRRHDLDAAERLYTDTLEWAQAAEDVPLEALSALRLASILLARGYAFQAKPHFERALELDRELDDPVGLQRVIARLAYEQRDYALALRSQEALETMAGDAWTPHDQALLEAFRAARETGRRQPLPAPGADAVGGS